jgi:hypothetical protein
MSAGITSDLYQQFVDWYDRVRPDENWMLN